MLGRTLRRITAAADLLKPSTLFRTLARVDRLVDSTRELSRQIEALRVQTEQLLSIQRLDSEHHAALGELDGLLDEARIDAHVRAAVDAAVLEDAPFPHVVVANWLPQAVYAALVRAVPPPIFFADRELRRQRLIVPFAIAPAYSHQVWRFVANAIVGRTLSAALGRKFAHAVRAYVRTFCPDAPADLAFTASDGRIMLRRPGYCITPHRDPKWGFVTGLIYLAKPGDNEAYGTQLYRVRDDEDAPDDKPFYIAESRCELVRTVPFRKNTLLAFLNSRGAHGASIPADADPPTLERYLYQFRLGPDTRAIKQLLAHMSVERRDAWGGSKAARASSPGKM